MAEVRPYKKFDPLAPLEGIQPGPDDSKPPHVEDQYHPKFGVAFRYFHDLIKSDFLQRRFSKIWLKVLKAENDLIKSILGVGHVGPPRVDAAYTNHLATDIPDLGEVPPPSMESINQQTARIPPVSAPETRVANQMAAGANSVYTT